MTTPEDNRERGRDQRCLPGVTVTYRPHTTRTKTTTVLPLFEYDPEWSLWTVAEEGRKVTRTSKRQRVKENESHQRGMSPKEFPFGREDSLGRPGPLSVIRPVWFPILVSSQ